MKINKTGNKTFGTNDTKSKHFSPLDKINLEVELRIVETLGVGLEAEQLEMEVAENLGKLVKHHDDKHVAVVEKEEIDLQDPVDLVPEQDSLWDGQSPPRQSDPDIHLWTTEPFPPSNPSQSTCFFRAIRTGSVRH